LNRSREVANSVVAHRSAEEGKFGGTSEPIRVVIVSIQWLASEVRAPLSPPLGQKVRVTPLGT